MKQQHQFTTALPQDDEQDAMTALLTDLVDDGLTSGLLALQFTYGISINPAVKYDVAAAVTLAPREVM